MRSQDHLLEHPKAHSTVKLRSTEVGCSGADELEGLGSFKDLHAF